MTYLILEFISQQVNELATAAGMHDVIDPNFLSSLKQQRSGNFKLMTVTVIWYSNVLTSELSNEDEHLAACLLLVFIAVSLPRLARQESSMYR